MGLRQALELAAVEAHDTPDPATGAVLGLSPARFALFRPALPLPLPLPLLLRESIKQHFSLCS